MGKIIGLNGQVIKSETVAPTEQDKKATIDVVVLFEDIEKVGTVAKIPTRGPYGTALITPQEAIAGAVQGLYQLSRLLGQKRLVVDINDKSDPLTLDKQLQLSFLQLLPEHNQVPNETEETSKVSDKLSLGNKPD
jgi:hypothetical protein